jgi:two-component system, NarL family, response regulator NreC
VSISIILVDDHSVIRAGLRSLLNVEPDLQVVGEAGDGHTALRLVEQLRPDVLLADISMPGPTGIEIAAALQKQASQTLVLIVSMYDDPALAAEAIAAGAKGYLTKRAIEQELIKAIRRICAGQTYIQSDVQGGTVEAPRNLPPPDDLSQDERRLVSLLAHGYSRHQIAEQLGLSPAELEQRRTELAQKLGLCSRVELLRYAHEYQLL